ncbi:dihydrolipoyl dehydrogenase family protein [Promicromonospora thailandica]|uniref:Dihydrolipoamide dehydrogenase n=1 Tax=Promicromonospora thailandica TaxID=765201 RepID=A0A9X2JWP4_9MICO|nr:NAD(P)/FAD-dependent oxidoreductase [Promicromonospora thailandica]MCP2263314.1 dihydrolipoamide dehydrogenase [Promicromonospora thailandica]BFF19537.1 NAD(P)/FAD-dependent oxidoreductase [Promicromonospora thailandica]
MTEQIFDAVVIGAGPVGENVADRIVQGGLTVAIVERELVGGECSYWACMPTKALLRDAAALRAVRSLPGARAAVTGELDTAAVLARRDAFAAHWHDDGQVDWLNGAGITLVRGTGRISAARTVEVTDAEGATTVLRARHAVVVATGTSARLPEIPGLADAAPWTSREAASAQAVPGRLAVIGGGVVGTEMATAYAALGAQVTMIARDGLLPAVEPFARDHVAEALKAHGVALHLSVGPERVDRNGDGTVRTTLADGTVLETDEVLVATGRTPNTTTLGLDHVGLTPGDWLRVDDSLRVLGTEGEPVGDGWLYAAGDVNRRALLTHQGKYQARAVGDTIVARAQGADVDLAPWGRHAATADERAVPQVIFTDPEIASVGHTAASAQAAGLRVRAVEYDLGAVAGASLHADGYTGRAAMIVDEDRKVVVGFTAVGPDVAELLHAATIAVAGEVPIDRLWHAVPAYPTVSEIWLRLLETYGRD